MKFTKEQLSKLSKEQKLKLLELIEEKKRRDKDRRPAYVPHKGQLRVHMSKALERYVFYGNGGGKSALLSNELHWAATGYNPVTKETTPVPAKICLLLDSPEKIDDILLEYRRWNPLPEENCHKRGRHTVTFITYDNGSTITVLTHDVQPMKLEGSQWTHIFADEPAPRHVFQALFRGGRIKGRPLQALLVGTPIAAAWLRKEVYEPWSKGELPHVECFRGTTYDNAHNLEEGYIDRFSAKLSDKEKEIRLKGQFFDLDGLALAHLFSHDVHIMRRDSYQWDASYPCVVSIDCHPSKPSHAIIVGADKFGPVVLKEFKAKLVAREFARELRKFMSGYRVLDIVCDDLGSAEGTGGEGFKSFIQILQEEGVRARPTTYADKHDEDWVGRLADALLIPDKPDTMGKQWPKLRILEGCNGTVNDIENVEWVKIKNSESFKPTLNIANRDWLSCLKYALACNLHVTKRKDTAYHPTKPVYGVNVGPQATKSRKALALKFKW